ncbi:MAG TPA: hypothetical protein VFN61_09195 [Acidimicrobiales bacterium]|nr:hypothetical protein [Acidimicrobiales bacterium]
MSDFAVWNLVAEEDGTRLEERLRSEGYAVRALRTAHVVDDASFWAQAASDLGFKIPATNWSSFTDLAYQALVPNDNEPDSTALVWYGAGATLSRSLTTFLMVFDVLVDQARTLYSQGSTVLLFLLGQGHGFPPIS